MQSPPTIDSSTASPECNPYLDPIFAINATASLYSRRTGKLPASAQLVSNAAVPLKSRYMLTSLLIPSRVPAARAQRPVGKPELQPHIFSFDASPRLREGGKPDGTGRSPRPWPERTCGSRRSFASSAWSGWCWGNGRRHLGWRSEILIVKCRVHIVGSHLLVHGGLFPENPSNIPSSPASHATTDSDSRKGHSSVQWGTCGIPAVENVSNRSSISVSFKIRPCWFSGPREFCMPRTGASYQ